MYKLVLIQSIECLGLAKYDGHYWRIVGTMYGVSSTHTPKWTGKLTEQCKYYDLFRLSEDKVRIFKYLIPHWELEVINHLPEPEEEMVAVACNGAAQSISLVVSNA